MLKNIQKKAKHVSSKEIYDFSVSCYFKEPKRFWMFSAVFSIVIFIGNGLANGFYILESFLILIVLLTMVFTYLATDLYRRVRKISRLRSEFDAKKKANLLGLSWKNVIRGRNDFDLVFNKIEQGIQLLTAPLITKHPTPPNYKTAKTANLP